MSALVLSTQQKEAAFHNNCEGAVLVQASAGSGKTRMLTERVRYLLTNIVPTYRKVLCLTFTNKAAAEIKERLSDIPNLEKRAFIGTFHSFCMDTILPLRAHEIGLKDIPFIFRNADCRQVLKSIFLENDLFKDDYYNLEPKKQEELITKYLDIISQAKRELVVSADDERPDWNYKRKILYTEYNDRLLSQNAMDYDDILLYAYRILTARAANANIYRRAYPYILIDEAQDLNNAQYQLIRVICGDEHKNVMMVGDPKQAIYAYNGADTDFMQKHFVTDFQATAFTIQKNYRSSTKVLALAEQIKPNGGVGENFFTGSKNITCYTNPQAEAQATIQTIKEWLAKGLYQEDKSEIQERISFENIAVLARNRFVLQELRTELENDEQLKNKFYIRKTLERFEPTTPLIKIFYWGMQILVNPTDDIHFKHILTELQVKQANTADKIDFLLTLNSIETNELKKDALNILVENFTLLKENPKAFKQAIENIKNYLLENHKTIENEDSEITFNEFFTAFNEINELASYWTDFIKTTSFEYQNISRFHYFLALNNTEISKNKITLSTVHAVKGLEFEIVFLIGMNEGIFPHYKALNDPIQLHQERNLAYVAITRAKRCIYVSYPQSRTMPWGNERRHNNSQFLKYLL